MTPRPLAGLVALAAIASVAQAQTPPTPPDASPATAPAPPSGPAAGPATTAAPAPAVPAPPAAEAPPPPPPPPPAPPPPPPAPPTDPTAIALLNALEQVCIPAANGGDLAKIAKTLGYKKSGDNFVYKQPGFQFTVLSPGSNPTQCHVDVIHPIDPEAPAKPLVIALHNWAAISRNWSLYRNDKNVEDGQEFTTRSWEHNGDGKAEALVITTVRKADGSPSLKNADTSMLLYSVSKTPG